jgi:hypothetical protein
LTTTSSLFGSKSLIGTLAGLAIAALVFQWLEGTVRSGAWAGFLLGAGLGCTVVGWQAGAFRRAPQKALETLALGFLVKLVVLAGMCITVRYWEFLGSRLEWQAFTLSATAGVVLLLFLGTWDNAPILSEGSRLTAQNNETLPVSQTSSADSSSAPQNQGRTAS